MPKPVTSLTPQIIVLNMTDHERSAPWTNQRLDGDFTIFAKVTRQPDSMPVVDQIAEGDEIQRIDIIH